MLNELLGHIYFYSHFNLDGIQARVKELLALLSRAAISSGADVGEISVTARVISGNGEF